MHALPLPQPAFNDGRGLYPETVSAGVPIGLRALLRDAARKEGVPVAEFIRRALTARIEMFRYAETVEPARPNGTVYLEG